VEELTPRERLKIALDHKEPDRVPIDFGGLQSGIHINAYKILVSYLGMKLRARILDINQQIVEIDEDILKRFKVDNRYIYFNEHNPDGIKVEKKGEEEFYRDIRGIVWRKPKDGYYFDLYYSPLRNAKLEDLEKYRWCRIYDSARFNGISEKVKFLYNNTDYALVANFQGILEGSWELRGIEKFFMDVAVNKKFVETLIDKVLETKKKIYGKFLDIVGSFLSLVKISDDLGTQTGLLFSPDFYRRIVKPRHRELVRFIKSKTEAKIAIHTDGAIMPILDDLIEAGFEVINPVQISTYGMSSKKLKEDFGNKISFWGAIDTQKILSFGTPGEVEEEVKKMIENLAPKGGYILASCHNIQAEVRPENICAMFEAAIKYGKYKK